MSTRYLGQMMMCMTTVLALKKHAWDNISVSSSKNRVYRVQRSEESTSIAHCVHSPRITLTWVRSQYAITCQSATEDQLPTRPATSQPMMDIIRSANKTIAVFPLNYLPG